MERVMNTACDENRPSHSEGKAESASGTRVAVVGAVLTNPRLSQKSFNETIASFKGLVKGRMGIPFDEDDIAVVSITLVGELDEINALTGKLGNIPNVTVKTAISGEVAKKK